MLAIRDLDIAVAFAADQGGTAVDVDWQLGVGAGEVLLYLPGGTVDEHRGAVASQARGVVRPVDEPGLRSHESGAGGPVITSTI